MNYVIYDKYGRIVRTGLCPPEGYHLQVGEGEFILEGDADDRFYYVLNGEIVTKPPLPITKEQGKYTIPLGTEVYVDGKFVGSASTGEVSITYSDETSTYMIRFSKFPYLEYEELISGA